MRQRGTRWWLAIAVAGLAMSGCGDDEADADRLAGELVAETNGALDEAQAACVAEGLVQSFGDDSFREVIDAAQGDGDDADDVRVEVIDIFASCDALDSVVLDDPDDPDGTAAGEPG